MSISYWKRKERKRWARPPYDPARPLAGVMVNLRSNRGLRYKPGHWRIA